MGQIVQEQRSFVGAHIAEETRAQLLELAREEDRSLASVIRRALDRELERAASDHESEEDEA